LAIFKRVMFVLLGIAVAVGIFCLTVGIGCAVNGLTFGQQIVEWFGSSSSAVENAGDTVETVAQLLA